MPTEGVTSLYCNSIYSLGYLQSIKFLEGNIETSLGTWAREDIIFCALHASCRLLEKMLKMLGTKFRENIELVHLFLFSFTNVEINEVLREFTSFSISYKPFKSTISDPCLTEEFLRGANSINGDCIEKLMRCKSRIIKAAYTDAGT
jgi:hypothetical protein